MFRRPISSFNKLTTNNNISTLFIKDIKGEIKSINHQKFKTQYNHSKLLVSLNSSTNFRNLLSNETNVEYPGKELSDFSICLIWLLIITIVIILLKCFLRNREGKKEKEKEKEKEKNIQTKNNELFDKARVDLENNILNSKSFSFIPISSPINLENIKTPISGNEIINLDQNVKDGLVVKAPKRLKVDNINSFTLKSEVEKLDV